MCHIVGLMIGTINVLSADIKFSPRPFIKHSLDEKKEDLFYILFYYFSVLYRYERIISDDV